MTVTAQEPPPPRCPQLCLIIQKGPKYPFEPFQPTGLSVPQITHCVQIYSSFIKKKKENRKTEGLYYRKCFSLLFLYVVYFVDMSCDTFSVTLQEVNILHKTLLKKI